MKKISSFLSTLPAHEKRITRATFFTLLRIALIPCIMMYMIKHDWFVAGLLFCCAAITDSIDGALARFYNERTVLGAFLDPLADKLLVLSCFSLFAYLQPPAGSVPWWFVILVLSKEIMLIIGAYAVYMMRGTLNIKPTWFGKAAMLVQVLFILWLFICIHIPAWYITFYPMMITAAVLFVIASCIDYAAQGIKYIRA